MLGVEDERGDAARPGRVGVGTGEQDERARVATVRDPLLRAGDAPAVPVRLRARAQGAGVGAGLRLREGERADRLPSRERRHEARPLLVAAEAQDRERRGARVHRDRDADARVRP